MKKVLQTIMITAILVGHAPQMQAITVRDYQEQLVEFETMLKKLTSPTYGTLTPKEQENLVSEAQNLYNTTKSRSQFAAHETFKKFVGALESRQEELVGEEFGLEGLFEEEEPWEEVLEPKVVVVEDEPVVVPEPTEAQRLAEEAAEEEAQRLADEEAEQLRLAEVAERQRVTDEEARRLAELTGKKVEVDEPELESKALLGDEPEKELVEVDEPEPLLIGATLGELSSAERLEILQETFKQEMKEVSDFIVSGDASNLKELVGKSISDGEISNDLIGQIDTKEFSDQVTSLMKLLESTIATTGESSKELMEQIAKSQGILNRPAVEEAIKEEAQKLFVVYKNIQSKLKGIQVVYKFLNKNKDYDVGSGEKTLIVILKANDDMKTLLVEDEIQTLMKKAGISMSYNDVETDSEIAREAISEIDVYEYEKTLSREETKEVAKLLIALNLKRLELLLSELERFFFDPVSTLLEVD